MLCGRKIITTALSTLFIITAFAQHPAREKIDSLKKLLPLTQGTRHVDCLNALSEEYWWPPRVLPDSIFYWAKQANDESLKISFPDGLYTSILNFGVAEIYRRNFLTAEKYLRHSLQMFDSIHNEIGSGWSSLWLGQSLYSQNNFKEAGIYFSKSVYFLSKHNLYEGEGKAWGSIGFLYAATGNYDSSFSYLSKSLLIRQKMNDHVCVAAALTNIGYLYKVAGADDDALDYYHQGVAYARNHALYLHATNWNYFLGEPMAIIYQLKNMPDSSVFYLQQALQLNPGNQMARMSYGENFLLRKQYDSALKIFLEPVEHLRRENNQRDLMRVLLGIAKVYEGKKNETEALRYVNESLSIAQTANQKQYMIEGYHLLAGIYNRLQKNDSAYFFIQKYISLKDSVTSQQFLWRLANYKKQADFKKQLDQTALLEKENKLKGEKLEQAAGVRWVLIIVLLIVALSGLIFYRSLSLKRKNDRLENQKKQSELQLKTAELEMQGLRAQMNPHFIFNCLSSINRFILINKIDEASDYLTKFSRLIRMALHNSQKPLITLEKELEALRLYLDLERLRFKDAFNYSITFINDIDINTVYIPPMIIQPFAENAIWHGLMHKKGIGTLEIQLYAAGKTLTCTVIDNGIGRNMAAELNSRSAEKNKSMGVEITSERLALLNKSKNETAVFNVEDLTDEEGNGCGTKVIITMPYKEPTEVLT